MRYRFPRSIWRSQYGQENKHIQWSIIYKPTQPSSCYNKFINVCFCQVSSVWEKKIFYIYLFLMTGEKKRLPFSLIEISFCFDVHCYYYQICLGLNLFDIHYCETQILILYNYILYTTSWSIWDACQYQGIPWRFMIIPLGEC